MAYIFKETELPSLISVVPGRERIFFVNQELASIDDMLAGVMHYKKGAASPLHLHKNCEHFYFIINGNATVESDEGTRAVGPGVPPSHCFILNFKRPIASRPRSSKAPMPTCAGSARMAASGSRPELASRR